jgi:acetyltransferase-like isoleucine patch superfamily enzyme
MILALAFALLPSFLNVGIRRLFGQHIGKGSKIKIGTILKAKNINIGPNVSIGPFCFIKAEELLIENNSVIKPFSVISTRKVVIKKFVHIAPFAVISSEFSENSKIEIGDHSRIFPYCWLDTGEGITIGNGVGVGGHSLIFTHGVWSDYLEGGPVTFGPVKINDNVWLPWRVFILPNVEIGKDSIVGANSLVNKSFKENSLIGGSPAKIIKEDIIQTLPVEEKFARTKEILVAFSSYIKFKKKLPSKFENGRLIFDQFQIVIDSIDNLKKGDLLILINSDPTTDILSDLYNRGVTVLDHKRKKVKLLNKNDVIVTFLSFLRRYGIRLYIE